MSLTEEQLDGLVESYYEPEFEHISLCIVCDDKKTIRYGLCYGCYKKEQDEFKPLQSDTD